MPRGMSTELHRQMMFWSATGISRPTTATFRYLSICSTLPTTITQAWKIKGGGYALARSDTASTGSICNAPGSTTVGWTVATCSMNNITVSTSGSAEHVCIMSGSSTGAMWFFTPCTTRAVTTSDTISVPSFNIRLGDPAAS